jgi:hypothetical protein
MEKFNGQNIKDFIKVFPMDLACVSYLADIKLRDGFF